MPIQLEFSELVHHAHKFEHRYFLSVLSTVATPIQYVPAMAEHCSHYYYYYNRFTTLCPGLPRWVSTRRTNRSGFAEEEMTGWQWHQLNHMQAICTSLQKITTPAPHQSDFYGLDALPDTQPTASKHWRHKTADWTSAHRPSLDVIFSPQQNCPHSKPHRPCYDLWPMKQTFHLKWAMVMTHTHA